MFPLDRDSNVPLADQIEARLRELIERAQLPPSSRLPSIRQLATQLGVSPNTVVVAYDLVWICLGAAPRELPRYPAHAAHPGQTVVLGPKVLQATGPRIVENFLDMAHFPFVHAESLGRAIAGVPIGL